LASGLDSGVKSTYCLSIQPSQTPNPISYLSWWGFSLPKNKKVI